MTPRAILLILAVVGVAPAVVWSLTFCILGGSALLIFGIASIPRAH